MPLWPCPGDSRETPAPVGGGKWGPSPSPVSPCGGRAHLLHLIHPHGEILHELVDVVHQPQGQVLGARRGRSAREESGTPPPKSQRGGGCREPLPGEPHRDGCRRRASAPPRPARRTQTSAGGQRKEGGVRPPASSPSNPPRGRLQLPHPRPFTFSLSSNIQKKGVMAPMSSACVVTAMMWLSSRVISAKRTGEGAQRGERGAERGETPPQTLPRGGRSPCSPRIHCARRGGRMLSSFSTAKE